VAEVDDRWWTRTHGQREKTARHGIGKRWRARWRDETGRQREQSFDKKIDADRHAATVEADMLRRTYIDPNAGRITFRAYAEKWRVGQIHQETTTASVESLLRRHVYTVFGDQEIASIKPSVAQAWIRGMQTGRDDRAPLMPATVQVVYRYVVAIGHAAVADKVISANPFVKLSRTRPVKKRVMPPTGKQVAALYEAFPVKLRAMVVAGAGVGMRQGEVAGIELDCIDFLHRKLVVRQQLVLMPGSAPYLRLPKGAKTREIPLADVVLAEFAEHVRIYPPEKVWIEDRTNLAKPVWRWAFLVFTAAEGGPLRRTRFSDRIWLPARRLAGLPAAFTFHDLRHYYASALIRYGESPTTVQARLGHASATETLDTYSHLWPDSEDRSRAAVEDAFRSDVGQMWAVPALEAL
jgi:integrase